ncbi:MAG: helix-turn-helix domain-containing protein [Mycolicibacterium sp.]|nr:helix-turn-helix domain-containing protein [Mycolicibacterium sp.]
MTDTKFILHLLANKADENFSCYPSIRTLMAESGAGRSTVMRALKELEASGLITRKPQFHDSGARRSSRYYLNHPLAPRCTPGPNAEPPRPDSKPALSHGETGGVSERNLTMVSNRDPVNPPSEPPTEPRADAMSVIHAMREPWRVGWKDAGSLLPAIEAALVSGWTIESLVTHLSRCPEGVRNPARVLARRLADLPGAPAAPRRTMAWCGECEDERSRTITVTLPDGTEAAEFCPRCSPQAQRQACNSNAYLFDEREVKRIGKQCV